MSSFSESSASLSLVSSVSATLSVVSLLDVSDESVVVSDAEAVVSVDEASGVVSPSSCVLESEAVPQPRFNARDNRRMISLMNLLS